MDEKEGAQVPTTNTGNGDQSQAANVIESANSAAERLEKATKAFEEAARKNEELYARMVIGGRGVAGQEPVKAPTIADLAEEKARKTLERFGIKK